MRIPWMNQYSNFGADSNISKILALEKTLSAMDEPSSSQFDLENIDMVSSLKKGTSEYSQSYHDTASKYMKEFDSLKFNIFEFTKQVSRHKVLQAMTMNAIV